MVRAKVRRIAWPAVGTLLAGALLALTGLAPAAVARNGHLGRAVAPGSSAGQRAGTATARVLRDGLVAFQDAEGIGLVDPASGRRRLLLAVPHACTTTVASSGTPSISLAGPVWASFERSAPKLYFWLTDWRFRTSALCHLPLAPRSLSGSAVLVEADPFTGALRVVAVAPRGLPCQPGSDLVAVAAALAFTNGGCDETTVEALGLPFRAGEQPLQAGAAIPPAKFCRTCAINARVLGSGPKGTVLFEELGLQTATPPLPSLQLFDPTKRTVDLLSPLPPPAARATIVAAATSPNGNEVAFAAGKSGAGVLDLRTGTWAAKPVPPCTGTCTGALSVSFSPSGAQLAIASRGEIAIDPLSGGGAPRVLMRGSGVSELSWSGVIDAAALGSGKPGKPPVPPGVAFRSIWAPFVSSGSGASQLWEVGPRLPAGLPSLLVSLPGTPSALLMVSDKVALAAGSGGDMWRSSDGGHRWNVVTAHCAELQMVTASYPPCDIEKMALLPGGVVLAGGPLGVWRSVDEGLHWQRQSFPASVVTGGPWTAGSTALVLLAPAESSGVPAPTASSLTLLASSDRGRTWHKLLTVSRRDPDRRAQAAFFDQLFVLGRGRLAELYQVGDCSLPADLRLSTDDGRQWRSIAVGPLILPSALSQAGSSRLILASAFCGSAAPAYGQGIFGRPVTSSRSWSALGMPAGYAELGGSGASRFPASSQVVLFSIAALVFPTGSEGIAVGSQMATFTNSSGEPAGEPSPSGQELIFASHDGGSTWSDVPAPGGYALSMLSCADATHCLAAGTASDDLVLLSPPRGAKR